MSTPSNRNAHRSFSVALLLAIGALGSSRTAQAQQASIAGAILSDGTEKPLANAEVVIESLGKSVRSDSAGNFLLSGLSAGRYSLLVRLLGFESVRADVTLGSTQKLEVDLLLKPAVTALDKVDVKAKGTTNPWAIKLAEFDERRVAGGGRYLLAEDFEKGDGRPVSTLLQQKIPGIKIIQSNGRRLLASARGGDPKTIKGTLEGENIPKACYMQIVVNGRITYNGSIGQPMYDIDQLNSKDIIGFEFYTTATTPMQYNATRGNSMGSCGTVIIWTKGG